MSYEDNSAPVRLTYRKIRDVSTQDEESNGATTYVAVMSASEILKVGTSGNLRDYIPSHPGKNRSQVHRAIGATIENKPDRFSQLNSGFLIGAARAVVDDQKKIITLYEASVNNGAQTQGEIDRYFKLCDEREEAPNDFSIRVEISVDPDPGQRTEIAIARNTATRIQDISQAGKRGYFDELNINFIKCHGDRKLALSETDIGDEYVNTRLLLQILWVLMPSSILPDGRTSIDGRMKSYKNAALCLTDFVKDFQEKDTDPATARRYKYFCDMSGTAWKIYTYWQTHEGWEGMRLRSDAGQVRRREGRIKSVADGVIFPALAALSNFIKWNSVKNEWEFQPPSVFRDEDLLLGARRQLSQHGGSPVQMGRSGAAYEALMTLTEMANRYAQAPSAE
jgi:hypothetical protein